LFDEADYSGITTAMQDKLRKPACGFQTELAHYNSHCFLVERNHEPFAVLLGIEEYRRLVAVGEGK
jgi:hypothetical protein